MITECYFIIKDKQLVRSPFPRREDASFYNTRALEIRSVACPENRIEDSMTFYVYGKASHKDNEIINVKHIEHLLEVLLFNNNSRFATRGIIPKLTTRIIN